MSKTIQTIVLAAAFALGWFMGSGFSEAHIVRQLIESTASAEDFDGGDKIRHAAIGGITRVQIYPDRVEVDGTEGTRRWLP